MRRGELVGLKWADVDLGNRTAVLHDTKNGERRVVPLSSKAAMIIGQQQPIGVLPQRESLVFPVRPDSVSQAFRRACSRAGLRDLRFHDLRHEATSRFFELGLSTMEVSAITGHKTLQMLKRYTHLKATELASWH